MSASNDPTLAGSVTASLRAIADFPRPGILFQDLTPVLADPRLYRRITDAMAEHAASDGVTHVAAIESRGFLFGAPIAQRLGVALVLVRKPGKLPGRTRRIDYALEYGVDGLEIHTEACGTSSRVLIVDDVLATGGTCRAAVDLVQATGAHVVAAAFVLEIAALRGRDRLAPLDTRALVSV